MSAAPTNTASASPAPDAQAQGGCCKGGPKNGPQCCGGSGGNAELTADLTRPMTAAEMSTLPTLHLVMRSRKGIEAIDRRVFDLTESQIDQAFLPDAGVGRWPVRVLIGHLADAELAAVHRMRRAVGEDNPVVSNWDEDAFVDANLYLNHEKTYARDPEADRARVMQALGGHLAVIHTLRQWSGQWLLTLDESQWERAFLHPVRGAVKLKDYVALNTWHVEHHAAFLTRKLDLMLGPAPAEEPRAGGGCGSGCGCGSR